MANLKFEGEMDGLSERQLEFVSSVLAKRGFSNTKVIIAAVGKADDNYVANVKRFVVEKDGQVFKMVAKIAANDEIARSKMKTELLFLNEHVMYTYVLPKFTELEKGADIPESERLVYAKCYGSLSEEPNEIILLEDLQMSDYVMFDKTKSYTDETVKLVLKNFAILHSLSYALKNREPETYEEFKKKLVTRISLMLEMEDMQIMLNELEKSFMPYIDNAKHKNIVKGLAAKIPKFAANNYKIDKDSKYSIIQQGDSWTNNMMFKLEGSKAVQCCMIDYQIANENSPVADIQYMIFACTDYETRAKHYHEWMDYYHAQLDKSLSNFDLKANFIYPRDQFDADLRRFGKFSFGVAMMLANIILVDTQEATKMKEAMKNENSGLKDIFSFGNEKNIATRTPFKAKITGLVNSFLELGYL